MVRQYRTIEPPTPPSPTVPGMGNSFASFTEFERERFWKCNIMEPSGRRSYVYNGRIEFSSAHQCFNQNSSFVVHCPATLAQLINGTSDETSTFMHFLNILFGLHVKSPQVVPTLLPWRICTGSTPWSQPSKFTFTHITWPPDDGDTVSETSDTKLHTDMAHQKAVNLLMILGGTVTFGFGPRRDP